MTSGPPAQPRVDVGIVTWNTADLTVEAIRRLLDTDQGCRLRVLVQDNASSDGTPDRIAEVAPEAEVVVNDSNRGFARAMNQLIARSDASWFFALNSDAWPEPGAIARLVETLESHPGAAAAAPLLLRPDGAVEHSTHPFPSLTVALIDAVQGRRWLPRAPLERRLLEGAWFHDRPREVEWAVGAALLLRRRALDEIGGFDERFFMYVEDLEWCWRAHRRGWSVRFDPASRVRHVGNASGRQRSAARRTALEATNMGVYLRTERSRAFRTGYRALRAVELLRLAAAARLGRPGADQHLEIRRHLKIELGLAPPLFPSELETPEAEAGDGAAGPL